MDLDTLAKLGEFVGDIFVVISLVWRAGIASYPVTICRSRLAPQ
jgi:hypothetical protein